MPLCGNWSRDLPEAAFSSAENRPKKVAFFASAFSIGSGISTDASAIFRVGLR